MILRPIDSAASSSIFQAAFEVFQACAGVSIWRTHNETIQNHGHVRVLAPLLNLPKVAAVSAAHREARPSRLSEDPNPGYGAERPPISLIRLIPMAPSPPEPDSTIAVERGPCVSASVRKKSLPPTVCRCHAANH